MPFLTRSLNFLSDLQNSKHWALKPLDCSRFFPTFRPFVSQLDSWENSESLSRPKRLRWTMRHMGKDHRSNFLVWHRCSCHNSTMTAGPDNFSVEQVTWSIWMMEIDDKADLKTCDRPIGFSLLKLDDWRWSIREIFVASCIHLLLVSEKSNKREHVSNYTATAEHRSCAVSPHVYIERDFLFLLLQQFDSNKISQTPRYIAPIQLQIYPPTLRFCHVKTTVPVRRFFHQKLVIGSTHQVSELCSFLEELGRRVLAHKGRWSLNLYQKALLKGYTYPFLRATPVLAFLAVHTVLKGYTVDRDWGPKLLA